MRIRKKLHLLAAGAAASLMLAGCAPGVTTETATTPAAPPQQQEVDETNFAGQEITYLYFYDTEFELKATEELVADFEAQTGASVNLQITAFGELEQTIQARLTGSDVPDVSRLAMLNVPTFADELMDLRTYFGEEYKSEFLPGPLAVVIGPNGEMLGAPSDVTMNGLLVNQDMFDAAGVEVPTDSWSWTEMMAAAEKVQAANGTPHAFVLDRSGHRISTILSQFGTYLIGEDGGNGLDREKTIEAFELFVGLTANERLSSDFMLEGGPTYASGNDLFLAQQSPVYLGGNWLVGQLEQNAPFNWAAAPNPKELNAGGFPGGKVTSAFKRSKNPELAAFFVKWILDTEQQRRMAEAANLLPTRADLSATGVAYPVRSDAMNVFVADIGRTPEIAFASTYSPIFGRSATALVDNLQRAIGGVLTVEEAVDKLISDVDALVAELG